MTASKDPDGSANTDAPPVDNDVDDFGGGGRKPRRPVHAMKRYLLLVALGGVFGTAARYELGMVLPTIGQWPAPTLIINLAGAFLLGMLLEGLARRGEDQGRRRILRLLVGTGFMGSFTTYSTLAVESVLLIDHNDLGGAGLYLAASLFGGFFTGFAGIWLAARQHRSATWTRRAQAPSAGAGGMQ